MTVISEISKGIIFIHDIFPEKDKEQNLILLYKNLGKNKEFNKIIIKLEPKVNIQNVIKELKNKEIEEILNILNNKKYNFKIIEQEKKELRKDYEEKRKEEENKRKKEGEKKRIEEDEKIKDNEMKINSIKQSDDKNEIKRLKDELEKYKIENEKLKQDLYKANKIIANIQKISNNNNDIINLKKENENLLYQLNQKENIINDLKNKLQNNQIEGPKYSLKDMLVIYFQFQDGVKSKGISCAKTETFAEVEERFYQTDNSLRNTNNVFLVNAITILRFKKLYENNIRDGAVILLIKSE